MFKKFQKDKQYKTLDEIRSFIAIVLEYNDVIKSLQLSEQNYSTYSEIWL